MIFRDFVELLYNHLLLPNSFCSFHVQNLTFNIEIVKSKIDNQVLISFDHAYLTFNSI